MKNIKLKISLNIFSLIAFFFVSCTTSLAAKIPSEVSEYITKSIPGTDIRFDGVIILPDNTIYLPLYPSLFSDIKKLEIKESYPQGKGLAQKADIIIHDFLRSDKSGDSILR